MSEAEHVLLRDGTALVVRLLEPADKALLRAGFDKLSADSRYARFLASKTGLTDQELSYLTEVDQVDHVAIGAIDPHGDGVGIARFIKFVDRPDTAEAAVAVADSYHRRGLGSLLFRRLCAAARARGISRFRCEVLGSNHSMHALIDRIAPVHTTEVRSGVLSIEMELPVDPALESGMYRLLRAAAARTVELTAPPLRPWPG